MYRRRLPRLRSPGVGSFRVCTDLKRRLAGILAAIVLAVTLGTNVVSASALAPPTTDARPTFVTETGPGTWDDCLWAAGAMLLDHWSGGSLRASYLELRRASGAPISGPSYFSEFVSGARALGGVTVRYSPNGGDPLTFDGLLDRLAHHGGAVVAGSYANLPASYTRWDRAFAAAGAARSGHAVYVQQYDAATDRIWLMDPLGRGSYRGEWIDADDLRAFIWQDRLGRIYAIPTPKPALVGTPFDYGPGNGLSFGLPVLAAPRAGALAELTIPATTPWGSTVRFLADVRITAVWRRTGPASLAPADPALGSDVPVASTSPTASPSPAAAMPPSLVTEAELAVTVEPRNVRAVLTAPAGPGPYRLQLTLLDCSAACRPASLPPIRPIDTVVLDAAPVVPHYGPRPV